MIELHRPDLAGFTRTAVLLLGPPLLVGFCYWVCLGRSSSNEAPAGYGKLLAEPLIEHSDDQKAPDLATACRLQAVRLAERLGSEFSVIVRPPFVVAGNCRPERVEGLISQTVEPFTRAFVTQFHARRPDEPVVLIVFLDNASYRRWAKRFDKASRYGYTSYYQRQSRRVLADISAGTGPLTHELTHALTHFDFPNLPEWFDEGLGALYETSQLQADGLAVRGLDNWRRYYVLYALRSARLRPLELLIRAGRIRPAHQALDYAHARYFCLFLQSQNKLVPFYTQWRETYSQDPTGIETLRRLFGGLSVTQIDNRFRHWLLLLK